MKDFIVASSGKLKVGVVIKLINTLLVLICGLAFILKESFCIIGAVLFVSLQIEGWPLQV